MRDVGFSWFSLGSSAVCASHMPLDCHKLLLLLKSVTPPAPCPRLVLSRLPRLGAGSQLLFRMLCTTCSPQAPSTQKVPSAPLPSITPFQPFHSITSMPLSQGIPLLSSTCTTSEACRLISCCPCSNLSSPIAMLQLNAFL